MRKRLRWRPRAKPSCFGKAKTLFGETLRPPRAMWRGWGPQLEEVEVEVGEEVGVGEKVVAGVEEVAPTRTKARMVAGATRRGSQPT